jgi:hypothetical protein
MLASIHALVGCVPHPHAWSRFGLKAIEGLARERDQRSDLAAIGYCSSREPAVPKSRPLVAKRETARVAEAVRGAKPGGRKRVSERAPRRYLWVTSTYQNVTNPVRRCGTESGRPDSNRRRPAWEAGILPTELRPQIMRHSQCSRVNPPIK